jgi:predicted CXXCH cytochrome family protein
MQPATDATVLGNFSDASFTKDGVRTRFLRRDGKFFVNTQGPDGTAADFEVKYTFGVDPLQQYLLELPRGRLQALTIAWDVEQKHWFDLYPDEHTDMHDELHWTQSANNWNFMCADCHSTGVQKNYDRIKDAYQTQLAQINVSCQACHGSAAMHLAQMRGTGATAPRSPDGTEPVARREKVGATEIAFTDQRSELESCARCHSVRSQISPQISGGQALLDTYLPSLPQEPLYFADGQIKGEVYEYGSFLQSRMHSAGVRCSDCHEPHTLKTRAEGNALCTRCHNDSSPALRHAVRVSGLKHKDYDSPAHHFHAPDSAGSRCVSCHMPSRTYMQVDERHDHSLRVPRPDLSVKIGTPNACNQCHRDRAPEWAAQAVARWYGPQRRQESTYGEALWAGWRREPGAMQGLTALLGDASAPAIIRATALEQLRSFPSERSLRMFAGEIADPDPLIRRAAVRGLELLAPEQRGSSPLKAALHDPVRAVRIEAAQLLAAAPPSALDASSATAMNRALREYEAAQRHNAERPESHLNLGNLYANRGEIASAERAYRDALRDANFVPAYVNLADLKAGQGALKEAESVLRGGLQEVPDSAPLAHALGLVLIRQQRREEALVHLRRAAGLAPDAPRYAYVYAVAVHDMKGAKEGVTLLRAALGRFPNDRDLLLALAGYARSAGDEAAASEYLDRLRSIEQ